LALGKRSILAFEDIQNLTSTPRHRLHPPSDLRSTPARIRLNIQMKTASPKFHNEKPGLRKLKTRPGVGSAHI